MEGACRTSGPGIIVSMDHLEDFVTLLLREGRVVLRSRPVEAPEPRRVVEALGRAYARYRLDVAGPLIPFDGEAALGAARLVAEACWALVCREEAAPELARRLTLPRSPSTPAHHLSADLLLRFVPQLIRRARALDPTDPLAAILAEILRRWPLSGVLARLEDRPASALDFGGHEGLMLLYAERWVPHENQAWQPSGRLLEYVELARRAAGGRRPGAPVGEGMAVYG
jgi:hypothetical protein